MGNFFVVFSSYFDVFSRHGRKYARRIAQFESCAPTDRQGRQSKAPHPIASNYGDRWQRGHAESEQQQQVNFQSIFCVKWFINMIIFLVGVIDDHLLENFLARSSYSRRGRLIDRFESLLARLIDWLVGWLMGSVIFAAPQFLRHAAPTLTVWTQAAVPKSGLASPIAITTAPRRPIHRRTRTWASPPIPRPPRRVPPLPPPITVPIRMHHHSIPISRISLIAAREFYWAAGSCGPSRTCRGRILCRAQRRHRL